MEDIEIKLEAAQVMDLRHILASRWLNAATEGEEIRVKALLTAVDLQVLAYMRLGAAAQEVADLPSAECRDCKSRFGDLEEIVLPLPR